VPPANLHSSYTRGDLSPSREVPQGSPSKALAASHRRIGITGLSFNRKQRNLIAASDCKGRTHVWRLNWSLANAKPGEVNALNAIADVFSEKERE
jgi:hypothetical protein